MQDLWDAAAGISCKRCGTETYQAVDGLCKTCQGYRSEVAAQLARRPELHPATNFSMKGGQFRLKR